MVKGDVWAKKANKPIELRAVRVSVAQGEEVRALVLLNALKMYLLLLDFCQLLITAGKLIFL